jgi:hypothetical protein
MTSSSSVRIALEKPLAVSSLSTGKEGRFRKGLDRSLTIEWKRGCRQENDGRQAKLSSVTPRHLHLHHVEQRFFARFVVVERDYAVPQIALRVEDRFADNAGVIRTRHLSQNLRLID